MSRCNAMHGHFNPARYLADKVRRIAQYRVVSRQYRGVSRRIATISRRITSYHVVSRRIAPHRDAQRNIRASFWSTRFPCLYRATAQRIALERISCQCATHRAFVTYIELFAFQRYGATYRAKTHFVPNCDASHLRDAIHRDMVGT